MKKTSSVPGEQNCQAGQAYFSSYGDCRPSSCPSGRAADGTCRSTTNRSSCRGTVRSSSVGTASTKRWSALELAKPIGVKTNGRNERMNTTGSVALDWDPVPNAAYYNIWYKVSTTNTQDTCAGYTTGTNFELRGLTFCTNLCEVYRVKVEALDSSNRLLRSEIVYAVPTVAKSIPAMGPIKYMGVRIGGIFEYSICENTLNAVGTYPYDDITEMATVVDKSEWIDQVMAGIEIWDTAVDDDMITIDRSTAVTNCSRNKPDNRVERVTEDVAKSRCKSADASACAVGNRWNSLNPGSVIYIRDSVSYGSPRECMNPNTKSSFAVDPDGNPLSVVPTSVELFRVAMHETGHTYGLDHVAEDDVAMWNNKTVMHMAGDSLCVPTELDILAIQAAYRDRFPNYTAMADTSTDTTISSSSTSASTSTVVRITTTTPTTVVTTTVPTTTAPTTTTTTVPVVLSTVAAAVATSTTSTTTTTVNRSVTLWQIETRPSKFDIAHREVEFALTSGNTFTYAGRTYAISSIKTYNRAPRIQATPDLEDHELPDRTLIRFWPVDTPGSVQTIRLSDGNEMPASHRWDLIWPSARHPINLYRNTTWHIDLTIPAEGS